MPEIRPLAAVEPSLNQLGQSASGPSSALLYMSTSVAIGFLNKGVLTVYQFGFPSVLLLGQMIVAGLIVLGLRAVGLLPTRPLTLARAGSLLPVALLYSANTVFGLASLSVLNVPMYQTLKRLTPAVVLALGWCEGQAPGRELVSAVGMITVGCLVAGMGDLSFSLPGYMYAGLSCLLQASYLWAVQRTGAEKGLDSATLMLYNSLLSAPALLVVTLFDGSLGTALARLGSEWGGGSVGFWAALAVTLLLGVLLNYTLFLCTRCNNALTTTVCGAMKGVVSTGLGFVLFGGVKFSLLNVAGIGLNTLGGLRYAQLKYMAKQHDDSELADEASSNGNHGTV